ncbi:zinc-ribbon domain-containing protein [Fusicatenibacter saccharivorans]|uniref:zinc-ribbon domain-containing protein n=1 Tax=Fusicatenibacter saccharivorans TaxID=1150298 RepID=UPI003F8BD977
MAMFDDVDKKLSGWFNAGAEKAKGMSETLRLSNAIREEESKQAELYRQMGKYFYDYFAVAAEGKMKEWCDGVQASQQQVQVYKEQIQTLKGTVSCPNCGAEVSSGSAFCNVCGTKIEHKVPKASTGRICPVCGASVPESAAFCTSCGTKIPAVMEETKSAPAVSTEKKRCSNCGNELEEGQMFCTVCGTGVEQIQAIDADLKELVLEEAETEQQFEKSNAVEEVKKEETSAGAVCSYCGSPLEPGQIFCTNCGQKQGE